jgi:LytS/YehU family sensor histidine kinase
LTAVLASFLWYVIRGLSYIVFVKDLYPTFQIYHQKLSAGVGELGQFYALARPLFGWCIIYFGYKYWLKWKNESIRSEKSAVLVKEAQLQLLRYQINPHFLFNSLSSIQGLITKDSVLADRLLTEFSEYFRYTLRDHQNTYSPLGQELEIVEKYLSIEKIRFAERLSYQVSLAPETLDLNILSFIVQPFVENSIKHGMRSYPDHLTVLVKSCLDKEVLMIEVHNSGCWIPHSGNEGIGIQNVRQRLMNAYAENHSLEIKEDSGWVKVTVRIKT